jgi:AraC family transcriptional regulator, dual regulator of chb operon
MPIRKLLIRDFIQKGQSHHFARLELSAALAMGRHCHDFPELFWVEEGLGVHLIGSERRSVPAGTLVFIRPEDIHTLGASVPDGRFVICNLAFRADFWKTFRSRHRSSLGDWFLPGAPTGRERKVGAAALDFLRRSGLELISAPRTSLFLERFLLNLAYALRGPEMEARRLPEWLREAAEQVEREKFFRVEPGGKALARVAQRSAAHVAREVRKHLGKTPTDWVNEMRMRHAAQLLAGTRREILDICGDCGFENVGHFYALFRAQHAMTPLAYRRRSRLIVRPE